MHSVARENLQSYLHSYKFSQKEPGIRLVHNSNEDENQRKNVEHFSAIRALEHAKRKHVAFAVKAQRDYDGSVDEKSPNKDHTISFCTNDFIHIHMKFNSDWWIGRIVGSYSEFGFVPTAKRLASFMISEDPVLPPMPAHATQEKSIWEPKCPYLVVPVSRPIILLGPTMQHSRLTQLLHLALRQEILNHFGDAIKYLKSDIGCGSGDRLRGARWLRNARDADRREDENREVEVIMRMTQKLRLVLIESPNIHTPDDVQHLPLAPIFFLIRVSDNKILCQLLRQTGTTRIGADIEVANQLKTMNNDRVGDQEMMTRGFEMVIEENGLKEATWRIISYLEKYLFALHYHPLVTDDE